MLVLKSYYKMNCSRGKRHFKIGKETFWAVHFNRYDLFIINNNNIINNNKMIIIYNKL